MERVSRKIKKFERALQKLKVARLLRLRNILVHVYDEKTACELCEELYQGPYLEVLERIGLAFEKIISKEGHHGRYEI